MTNENVVCCLLNDLKYPYYSQNIIKKEIQFISENMFLFLSNKNDRKKLMALNPNIIEQILCNEHLVIQNEDQLLLFINELYNEDASYSALYKYIDFLYCSSKEMNNFLNTFCIEYIDTKIWQQLRERLEASVSFDSIHRKHHHQMTEDSINGDNQMKDGDSYFPKRNDDLDGIINYLKKSKNINDEIEITSSSICNNEVDQKGPYNVIQYDQERLFISGNLPNSWICFQFKNYQVILTSYTIRSRCDYDWHHLTNWAIEISKDNSNWEEIDRQEKCQFLKGIANVHTFDIAKSQQKEAKFIRLIQRGKNSSGYNYCIFNSIEFYGYLRK